MLAIEIHVAPLSVEEIHPVILPTFPAKESVSRFTPMHAVELLETVPATV